MSADLLPADATINPVAPTDAPSRYVVGIDLGTTNSAVCSVDTEQAQRSVEIFAVPQIVAPGQVDSRDSLPSFYYQALAGEFPDRALSLPWEDDNALESVGLFAREQGKLVPGHVVESAKSWLCHPGVDRTSPLLPWQAGPEVKLLSPVEVSAKYLGQIRAAWNAAHPQHPLENQDVVVTLPASFDEVARELTIQAARLAGLPRLSLIEEPQAAFYAWIDAHQQSWSELVSPGQTILVCDIGGGTTDFTLIRVRETSSGEVQFQRVAVGDHLILGGDNLDLALARAVEQKLENVKLTPRQWGSLVRICRHAKETLLGPNAPESYPIVLASGGSSLIGGGLQVELQREEVQQLLLDGFFPAVTLQERPQKQQSGFQEFGLPYAADPAITRYLAAFLSDHVDVQAGARDDDSSNLSDFTATRPDVVLFNGGAFLSPLIQQRIVEQIETWFRTNAPDWTPHILENSRHDLAVARGAAYYGMVRRGEGVKIAAGLPRTYYIGIGVSTPESPAGTPHQQALAVIPAGAEPGFETQLDAYQFDLMIATPVEFPLYYSSTRLTDPVGALVEVDREQLTPLPPIRTVLQSRKTREAATLPVVLQASLNELGTLQLGCREVNGMRAWQLQFDVRAATQTDRQGHRGTGEAAGVVDAELLEIATVVLLDTFGRDASEKPAGIIKQLSRTLHLSRESWPPSLLRQMWEVLIACEPVRATSAEHESRWLNLVGYTLRPGFGMAMDDWRVAETWKLLRGNLHFTGPASLTEWWILWRRIAGGLTTGQQQALAAPLVTSLREKVKRARPEPEAPEEAPVEPARKHRKGAKRPPRKPRVGNTHELAEAWRMLGACEQLSVPTKMELGELVLEALDGPLGEAIEPALYWTLGRLGARQPLYGPLNRVVPAERITQWLDRLLFGRKVSPEHRFAVMQLARRTGDRYRDLDDALRERVVNWLHAQQAPEHLLELVQTGGDLASREAEIAFGEALPIGLELRTP